MEIIVKTDEKDKLKWNDVFRYDSQLFWIIKGENDKEYAVINLTLMSLEQKSYINMSEIETYFKGYKIVKSAKLEIFT